MTTKLHICHDAAGYYIADQDGFEAFDGTYPTRKLAQAQIQVMRSFLAEPYTKDAQAEYDANIIDGYNRDDLGESPDY